MEINPDSHWRDWCWDWSSNTLATWCKELTHLKRPWCWDRLKVRGEGDNRGWNGWMPSPNQWAWVWAISGGWWRTEAWCFTVHRVANSQTWLSDWTATATVGILVMIMTQIYLVARLCIMWRLLTLVEGIHDKRLLVWALESLRLMEDHEWVLVRWRLVYSSQNWSLPPAGRGWLLTWLVIGSGCPKAGICTLMSGTGFQWEESKVTWS